MSPSVVPMQPDVFISHSTVDARVAAQVCASIEDLGTRCWVAPRNVMAGYRWADAIIEGIEQSRALLVILSAASNASEDVAREVERAAEWKKAILCIRLEAIRPSRSLTYWLSPLQWMDAFPGPLETRLGELAHSVVGAVNGTRREVEAPVQGQERKIDWIDLDEIDPPFLSRLGRAKGRPEDRRP